MTKNKPITPLDKQLASEHSEDRNTWQNQWTLNTAKLMKILGEKNEEIAELKKQLADKPNV